LTSKLESGLLWFEKRIRDLSVELCRTVDGLEWPRSGHALPADHFFAGIIPLKLWHGEEFRIVEFRDDELKDVEDSPAIQERLSERIREALGGISCPPAES